MHNISFFLWCSLWNYHPETIDLSESGLSIFKAFENQPIFKIVKNKNYDSTFTFEVIYPDVVLKIIEKYWNLNIAKSCQMYDIVYMTSTTWDKVPTAIEINSSLN